MERLLLFSDLKYSEDLIMNKFIKYEFEIKNIERFNTIKNISKKYQYMLYNVNNAYHNYYKSKDTGIIIFNIKYHHKHRFNLYIKRLTEDTLYMLFGHELILHANLVLAIDKHKNTHKIHVLKNRFGRNDTFTLKENIDINDKFFLLDLISDIYINSTHYSFDFNKYV